MDYHDMIEREKRRRALLVQKLDETDRRIALLISMSDQADPLDKWLDEQTSAQANPSSPSRVESMAPKSGPVTTMTRDTPRKISGQWIDLISFLGLEGKDFGQVQAFLTSSSSPMTAGAVRTGLMNYRKSYGLVANPKPGFYVATPKGLELVASHRSQQTQD